MILFFIITIIVTIIFFIFQIGILFTKIINWKYGIPIIIGIVLITILSFWWDKVLEEENKKVN